jgi:hypothetical protein
MAWGYFYNGTIRKYIIMFGSMFNDIKVVRRNKAGEDIQTIPVPIAYGPSEKFLERLQTDPTLSREVAIQLPRLSFELESMEYAPDRALNKTLKNTGVGLGTNTKQVQYSPIPYNFNVTLYGMFDNNEDAVQVAEQILPFFRPEWTNNLELIPEIGDKYDVPTILNSMNIEDTYESDYSTRRAIIYSWSFTIKGYLFGPISNKGVIKRSIVDLVAQPSGNPIAEETGPQSKITLTPGVTSEGLPTTDVTQSVAIEQIEATDDWGYAFDKEDFFDGINRHDH